MEEIDRRRFLGMIAAGAGAVAVFSAVPGAISLGQPGFAFTGKDSFRFRAVAGLPQGPVPSYASQVIEGSLDLTSRRGTLVKSVFAGPPDAMSDIPLPGLSRVVRVTDVRNSGTTLYISGVMDDRSQLRRGRATKFSSRSTARKT